MPMYTIKFKTQPKQAAQGKFETTLECPDLVSAEGQAREHLKKLNNTQVKDRWGKPKDGVKWQIVSVKEE